MARTLMVYASHHGQTAKIVERLAAQLRGRGHEVTVWRADRVTPGASIAGFDAYLVAGSVELGKHQRSVRDFVRSHVAELDAAPSAFVSVCGALIGGWPDGPSEARKYVDRFLAETGWHPRTARSLAGAVAYTKYGWFTRWMMKQISRKTGRPTDTSRDWEGTDWQTVDRLADELADAASPSTRTAVVAP